MQNDREVVYNVATDKQYFIIDFDSTFTTVEALDELATIALKGSPKKEALTKQIAQITKQGMEGQIDFPSSLKKRLALFKPTTQHLTKLIALLKNHITPSALRNKEFFQTHASHIYIVSGGFEEYVWPVVKDFGIAKSHVLANTFIFNKKNEVTGFDKKNLMAKPLGKTKAVENLSLKGTVSVIGDGITDYQIKEQGVANYFFAFTETVTRKGVAAKADKILKSFDELLHKLNLPRSQSFPKSKMKVLLLENISQEAASRFKHEGYKVISLKHSLSPNDLAEEIEDVAILGIRSKTEVTQAILDKAKKLLAIGSFAIGTNQINLEKATENGIAVFNAPYSNTRSVVELTMGEIIMLLRKAFDKSAKMHKGEWDKSSASCFEVRGKTLGIIGYGNIGSQLSVLAENFGMRVYFYDVADKLAIGNAQKCHSLEEVLKISDVITIHVDGSKTNKNLISKKEFDQMKNGAVFLNLSRGFIVDTDSLVANIKSGKISGAAVDVFPQEPRSNNEPFVNPLQGLQNVILTPHIGGSTEEAQRNIGEFVSGKLTQFIDSGDTLLSVNFPSLSLPPHTHVHRLIHIHKNIPGILSQINATLAQSGVNILGQYLKTNERIGYVISDIDKKYDMMLTKKLREIPGTIRVRELY